MAREKSAPQVKDIFADQPSGQAERMRAEIARVARRPYNILITGETGTGKTLMARQIHQMSARAQNPLIELNCANLPEQLVEAELFGHRKGAFTGADHDRKGLFEEANGGILFLDEIGGIAPTVQNRLLKAIEEKQVKRLGTNHYRVFDVQIIAATSRNLPKMMQDGEFREDLYCRLAVLTVETSPLRERREDIPAIVARCLREASDAVGIVGIADSQCSGYRVDADALTLLCECDYPGNIRSLRNVVYELTSYVDDGDSISKELVQFALARLNGRSARSLTNSNNTDSEVGTMGNSQSSENGKSVTSLPRFHDIDTLAPHSLIRSIAKEGDIILPLELCVLRRGETFRQWSARAKRCSIEAARQATGGTMRMVAERLGLTPGSLKSHLQRAKRVQNEKPN